jgi:hypothetical protein
MCVWERGRDSEGFRIVINYWKFVECSLSAVKLQALSERLKHTLALFEPSEHEMNMYDRHSLHKLKARERESLRAAAAAASARVTHQRQLDKQQTLMSASY